MYQGGEKDKYLTLGYLEILTSYSLHCSDELGGSGLKFALPQQRCWNIDALEFECISIRMGICMDSFLISLVQTSRAWDRLNKSK